MLILFIKIVSYEWIYSDGPLLCSIWILWFLHAYQRESSNQQFFNIEIPVSLEIEETFLGTFEGPG